MTKITATIIIEETPGTIFAVASHFPNDVLWRRGVVEHRLTSGKRAALGVQATEILKLAGKTATIHSQITEFEPGRRVAFESVEGNLTLIGYREVERFGNITQFTFHLEVAPRGLMKTFSPILLPLLERQTHEDVARLKTLIENSKYKNYSNYHNLKNVS